LIEDAELALLDEVLRQTQEELAGSLGVTQSTISMRLKVLIQRAMIQKQGNWIPYELKPRDLERCFSRMNNYFNGKNGKLFCIVSLLVMKSGLRLRQSKAKRVMG